MVSIENPADKQQLPELSDHIGLALLYFPENQPCFYSHSKGIS
jgi:hypothetical protein